MYITRHVHVLSTSILIAYGTIYVPNNKYLIILFNSSKSKDFFIFLLIFGQTYLCGDIFLQFGNISWTPCSADLEPPPPFLGKSNVLNLCSKLPKLVLGNATPSPIPIFFFRSTHAKCNSKATKVHVLASLCVSTICNNTPGAFFHFFFQAIFIFWQFWINCSSKTNFKDYF